MDGGEGNTKNPDRGPLLIIEGEKDHTVPWAIANAAYAAEAQPRGDRDREDPEPRPRPHDRPAGRRLRRPHSISSSVPAKPS